MTDTTENLCHPIDGSFMRECFTEPPVWEEIMDKFKINVATTIFTFADTIYNPARAFIDLDYVKHEELHAQQQGHDIEGAGRWWARYFQDQYFRIDQEAKAYAHQMDWWIANNRRYGKDRNWQSRKLRELARTLASPMYGSVINERGAVDLIRKNSKLLP